MPSHKIHIYVEEELNKYLKLDEDLFKLGNVLPDLVRGKHSTAHFKISKSEYDIDSFIKQFNKELKEKNPLVLGYLTHLLTDDYYNRYIREKYFVYGEDNLPCGIKKNNKIIKMDRKEIFDNKHKDLENYDLYLLKNHEFINFKKEYIDVSLFDVDENEVKEYIEKYNYDIKNTENLIEEKYIFLEKEELHNIINDVILYITKYLDENILEN